MTRRAGLLVALLALAWVVAPVLEARVGGGSSFGSRSSSSRSYSSSSSSRGYSGGYSSGGSSHSSGSWSWGGRSSSSSSGGYGGSHGSGGGGYSATADFVNFLMAGLIVSGSLCIVILLWMWASNHIEFNYKLPSFEFSFGQPPAPTFDQLEQRAAAAARGLDRLRQRDLNFSHPLFLDFAQLLYTRGVQARATGQLGAIAYFLRPAIASRFAAPRDPCDAVEEIVVGKMQIVDVTFGAQVHLTIEIDASMVEVRGASKQPLYLAERWTLARDLTTLSGGPEKMRALSCPSCAAPGEPKPDGSCSYCGEVSNQGQFQWVVEQAVITERGTRPDSGLLGGGEEVGTDKVTLRPRDFASRWRAFQGRHPEFDWDTFEVHVRRVFCALQYAWSEDSADKLRAYETDNIFNTHRYWLERYRSAGYRNQLEQISIERVKPVNFEVDAFYESITVRIWATMLDYTVDSSGSVVSGSNTHSRRFSEYWTFIACVGAADQPPVDARCPSCAGELKLSHTGVCAHCDAVVTSGQFGWVLSRIDQDEVYSG